MHRFGQTWCGGTSFWRLGTEPLSCLTVGYRGASRHVFSDASGSFGCGAVWGDHWFQFQWPGGWGGRNITLKEILPVVFACGNRQYGASNGSDSSCRQ